MSERAMKPETELRRLKSERSRERKQHALQVERLESIVRDLRADVRRLQDLVDLAKLFAPVCREQSDE